ncbi:MAG: GGDEF domain-containing protein [Pilosibacter sp.]
MGLGKTHPVNICGKVTLISVLYYLYCNEMWNQLDGLTGLLSQKSYLNRTLNLRPEDKMLIVLDLDNFKYINDTYGHQAGDQCLKVIAECLKKAYSRYGNCYRIGGDEFCVLFREPKKEKYCREKFYWIIEKRKKSLHMLPGASYGSALIEEQESISDTKARADANMYANKKARKQAR